MYIRWLGFDIILLCCPLPHLINIPVKFGQASHRLEPVGGWGVNPHCLEHQGGIRQRCFEDLKGDQSQHKLFKYTLDTTKLNELEYPIR